MRYDGKVTIITGGTRGIGEGCVRAFVGAGSKVVFCARQPGEGDALACELNRTGLGAAYYVPCDISIPEQIEKLIDAAVSKFGRIDCLINNAGVHPPPKSIDDFSIEQFKDLFNLNVVGAFAACKFALPHLRKSLGSIINISSLVGVIGQPNATTYVATKGALTAFTKALAIDEAANGVRVNSVSPGNVWTPLWSEGAAETSDPQKTIKDGEEAQLLGRMATIEECGKLCLFIAAEATFTTGVDHLFSGGAELSYGRKTRVALKK